MRRLAVALVAMAALLGAACGGGDEALDEDEFCNRLEDLFEEESPEDADAFLEQAEEFDELTSGAPEQIQEDMEVLNEDVQQAAQEVEEDDPNDEEIQEINNELFTGGDADDARGEVNEFAADDCDIDIVGVSAESPADLGDDPEFQPLAESCFDGDFAACDELYQITPIDSEYEAYGATCGGRLEEEMPGECQSFLGGG